MRLLPLFALLLSCSEKPVQTPPPPPSGWRPASVEAQSQGEGDNFWWRLTSAGNRLLAMTGMGDIWVSESYSAGFRKMEWKNPGTPSVWYAEGDSVWIGTEKPGRLYGCRISSWSCTDLKSPDADSFDISYVGKLKGKLIANSVAGGVRSLWAWSGGGWQDWSQGFPLDAIYRSLEIGDTLWAATWSKGLWYRVGSEASWKKPPPPRSTWLVRQDSAFAPRGLAWHHGALWVSDWTQEITRMPNGKPPYSGVTNCLQDDNGPIGGCRNPPLNPFALLSYRDRLFVGGYYGAAPYVLDETTGFWITTEIAGWCWNEGSTCGGKRTWDLVGLGDTLYSASSRFIMKIPLSEVPGFQPSLMAKFHWSSDTSWRDSVLRRNNPIGR